MISAILLAAGQSKRMDGENKLTKEIKGIPLIKLPVKNILASSVDELIIVLGYQKEIIEKLIDKNEKIYYARVKNNDQFILNKYLDNSSQVWSKTINLKAEPSAGNYPPTGLMIQSMDTDSADNVYVVGSTWNLIKSLNQCASGNY